MGCVEPGCRKPLLPKMRARAFCCLYALAGGASAHLAETPSEPIFDITSFGAVGDNHTINTAAIQSAIQAASDAGGGLVLIPSGVYQTGSLNLLSNTFLAFSCDGWLQGRWDNASVGQVGGYFSDWDYWHIVQAVNVTNVGLIAAPGSSCRAGGIQGIMWQTTTGYDSSTQFYVPSPWTGLGDAPGCIGECRVKNLAFIDCTGVILQGVQLAYSSDWTLLLRRTSNVLMEDVWIYGSTHWPNGDGMDIESGHNITLSKLNISTGDDAIAVRSGNCNTLRTPWPEPLDAISPLTDVRISNCTLQSSSAAIKIEALFQEAHGNISGITIDSVNILPGTNRGIGIWQRVGNPARRDGGGWISDISISNVNISAHYMFGSGWWGSGEALVITSVPETPAQAVVGLPGIHNVTITNMTAVAENGILISARDQAVTNTASLTGITLQNVALTITRNPPPLTVSTWAQHDFRPCEDNNTPETIPARVDGLYIEHGAGVSLSNVSVTFTNPGQPYWNGALLPGSASGARSGHCLNTTADSVVSIEDFSCQLATSGR